MNQPQQSLLQLQSILAALLIWSGSVLPSFAADEPFGDFSETPIYEVGEVPFQKVWHGDTLKLRLRSEALGSAAIITATYVLPPTGEIHFPTMGNSAIGPVW
ncbi:MAG: hypothetical protein IPK15_14585 [Verrucomicrobia bacterium]|nr:hypothetical protein [Verrucomicrobiota bacterium]